MLQLFVQNLKAGNVDRPNVGLQKPEVVVVSFNKLKNSIGLSIVAAKVTAYLLIYPISFLSHSIFD